MRRWGTVIALLLVLLANAVALIGVASNRLGEPDAVVVLTERELPLVPREGDDTGITLRLAWGKAKDEQEWLDAGKMAALGFDPDSISESRKTRPPFWKLASRQVFVVLDCGDDSDTGQDRPSRPPLVPVDAGTDPAALRRQYPERDRHLIVPAVIGLRPRFETGPEERERATPAWTARIEQILVDRIHVPRRYRGVLEPLIEVGPRPPGADGVEEPEPSSPRYRATVAFGRSFAPWIRSIDRIP